TRVRQIDSSNGRAAGTGRRLWLLYRWSGGPVLFRARRKLGRGKSEDRRQANSGQDRQGIGFGAAERRNRQATENQSLWQKRGAGSAEHGALIVFCFRAV